MGDIMQEDKKAETQCKSIEQILDDPNLSDEDFNKIKDRLEKVNKKMEEVSAKRSKMTEGAECDIECLKKDLEDTNSKLHNLIKTTSSIQDDANKKKAMDKISELNSKSLELAEKIKEEENKKVMSEAASEPKMESTEFIDICGKFCEGAVAEKDLLVAIEKI